MPTSPATSQPGPARAPLVVLAALAGLWTAYFAKSILAPIAIALLLKFLLSPIMRGLKRRFGMPTTLSAALLVGGAVGGPIALAVALAPAAMHWTEELPERMHRLEGRLLAFTEPVAAISAVTEKVGEKVDDISAAATARQAEPAQVVRIEQPGWVAVALGELRRLLIELFVIVVLLYLLLVSDGIVLDKLEQADSPCAARWALALREIEHRTGLYVTSMLAVQGGLGLMLGLGLWSVGMPNPLLWGVFAAAGNAVPFVGPLVVVSVLAVVSLTTFAEVGIALVPPAIYLVLHLLENNLVTPLLLGRWLSLSPVAIFLSLSAMGFLWGVAGLLLAVPLLVAMKICCEYAPGLRPLRLALEGSRSRSAIPDTEHHLAF